MKYIYMDLESFSECNLPKCGAHRYAEDPSTEVLLWGYAIGDEPAKVWDVANDILMPDDLAQALADVKAGKAKTVWHNGMNFDSYYAGKEISYFGYPSPDGEGHSGTDEHLRP